MNGLRLSAKDYPGKFVPADTWATRMNAGTKALLSLVLSVAAFWARTPLLAVCLGVLLLALYASSGLLRAWLRDSRLLLFQFPLLFILYAITFGLEAAPERAAVVAAQITWALLPALWLQRTTSPGDAAQALRRVLPGRTAFVVFTSLRFLPLLLREAKAIHTVQMLRGAPIGKRHLTRPWKHPGAFPALARCVGLPLTVRTLKLSREAALAARARGLDRPGAPDHSKENKP